jgi:hypothetical protein
MNGAFSKPGREEKCIQSFGTKTWKEETTRDLGMNNMTYCHMLVTRHGIWINKWIQWTPTTRNYKQLQPLPNPHTLQITTAHAESWSAPVPVGCR